VPAAALAFPELDHCASVMNAPHVCFVHGTWAFDSPWEALGVGVLAAALAAVVVVELMRLLRARRIAAALLVDGTTGPVMWTDDDEPFAFAVGVLRPRIIVSSGLRRSLTTEQLEAALAHERAHARRGHALVRSAARVVGSFTLPSLKRRLVDLLVLAQELEADEDAAAVVGSRTLVAETLLRCARLTRESFRSAVSPALTGSAFERRVESLCRPPRRGKSTRALLVGSLVAVAVLAFARVPLHQASESIAGALFSSAVHAHHDRPFLERGAE
jgi:Zn-dependent protease with chaperone function